MHELVFVLSRVFYHKDYFDVIIEPGPLRPHFFTAQY